MEAEIMFDNPAIRDRAVAALTKRGFDVEFLDDRFDECGTPTVWITVRGAASGLFCTEIDRVAEPFGGTVLEVGLLFPL
jgi:hypothetical protein